MGFFDDVPETRGKQGLDVALLHRMGCKACPLAQVPNKNPDMPPSGADKPLVYILAEAPGRTEDEEDTQLVGESGVLVRARIPRDFKKSVRFNNVVRTRPPDNREPTRVEVECCRPSIIKDIEQTKPVAIFGFGNVPLEWVMPDGTLQGVSMWRGRRMPVKVGSHTCWYFPFTHPAYILRQRGKKRDFPATAICSEEERMFALDIKRAFAAVDNLPEPRVHTPADVWAGLDCLLEGGSEGIKALARWFKWAHEQPILGFDYETSALRPYGKKSKLLTAALSSPTKGFAFPLRHSESPWTPQELAKVEGMLIEFLDTYEGLIYVHNLAFELEWTGVKLHKRLIRKPNWGDTTVQASVLDERKGKSKPGCFSLEFLVQQRYGINLKKLSNLDRKNLDKVPLALVLRYNGGDAKYHCILGIDQDGDLEEVGLNHVYFDSLRRVPTVVLSQIKGVPIDQVEVARLRKKYEARYDDIMSKIMGMEIVKKYEKIKQAKFNPFSTDDVLYIFKDMLKREECKIYDKKQRKDRYSADEDVLDKIDHPLAKEVVKIRKARKQLSTYIYPLQPYDAEDETTHETVVHDDGEVHATFNTIFARTGRLSCESPNLQNYPKRDGEAKEVRKQVKAPPGHVILAVDYGQIEARVIAMFTKDPVFVKALWENYDVHMEWAERIAWAYPKRIGGEKFLKNGAFKVKGSEAAKAMKDFRTDIKNQWTFPLFFGAQLQSAAGYLNIPEEKLAPQYDKFWEIFKGVKDWQEDLLKFYQDHGYVSCLTDRRRRGPITTNMVYNCVDTATECLSERGWVTIDELSVGDRIWTKNIKTGAPELQTVTNINRQHYQGKVHVFSGAINSVSTPNHRWLVDVRKASGLHPTLVRSDQLIKHKGSDQRLHLCADFPVQQKGVGSWSDDEVSLIGWILTDGTYVGSWPNREARGNTAIGINQSVKANPTKVALIDQLLTRLGLKYGRYHYPYSNGMVGWKFSGDLGRRIKAALPAKTLTADFLSQLSSRQLGLLFETMLLGDGTFSKELGAYTDFAAGTRERADMFSMLCVMLGVSHNIEARDFSKYKQKKYASMPNIPKAGICWGVQLRRRNRAHPGFKSSWQQFSGEVWCPTVGNGTWFARRQGRVYVTGNSPVQGTAADIVMDGMCRLSETGIPELQPEINIHDDLTYCRVPINKVDDIAEKVIGMMLDVPFDFVNVPITVEAAIGEDWLNLKEFGTFSSDTWFKGSERGAP